MIVDCLSMLFVYLFVSCLACCCYRTSIVLPVYHVCSLHEAACLNYCLSLVLLRYLHFVTCLSCLFPACGCLSFLFLVSCVIVTLPLLHACHVCSVHKAACHICCLGIVDFSCSFLLSYPCYKYSYKLAVNLVSRLLAIYV